MLCFVLGQCQNVGHKYIERRGLSTVLHNYYSFVTDTELPVRTAMIDQIRLSVGGEELFFLELLRYLDFPAYYIHTKLYL